MNNRIGLIVKLWSSLGEGDEQLDRPNSQTTLELCHACVVFMLNLKNFDFCLGQSSLHLLLLKSSMVKHIWMLQCMCCIFSGYCH